MTKQDDFPKVVVVVLLYNGLKWIDICLKTIMETDYPNYKIVIVDNNSSDDGCAYIERNFKGVTIIRNKKNYGTAGGNNIGIRHALREGADYVALFNQDLKVDKDWLKNLIRVAENSKETGLLSPLQYNYEGSDIDQSFKEIIKETTYFNDVERGDVQDMYFTDFVIGASLLVKKEVFLKIGLFDPLYVMYSDDNDFCRRAIYRGFKIAIVPNSKIYHYHSLIHERGLVEGKGKTKQSARSVYLFKRNYLILLLKNPNQPFIYNMQHAYIWTNWWKLFEEVESRYFNMSKVFAYLLVLLPVIYWKYLMEKRKACYLNLSIVSK